MISIIVPVYNTEKYLDCCIQSILVQTYTDFELLLIDDGSTDSSGAICDKYAKQDSRVRVFHKENGGLSSARNYGLEKHLGEYVIFCDSDDFWTEKDALSIMISYSLKYNLDVVRGELSYVDEEGVYLWKNTTTKSAETICLIMQSGDFIESIVKGKWWAVVSLYHSSILVRFDDNQKFQEDIEFHIRLFLQSLRCMYIPLEFYAYRMRSNSIMHNVSPINLYQSFCLSSKFLYYSDRCYDDKTAAVYKYYSVMMYYWNLCTLVRSYYHQRLQLICDFGLCCIQHNVLRIAKWNFLKYPIFVYFNPNVSCILLKKWLQLKKSARMLLKPFIK